jgi:hypothetical protein
VEHEPVESRARTSAVHGAVARRGDGDAVAGTTWPGH